MAEDGRPSKKTTVGAVGIAAELAVLSTGEPSKLSFFVAAAIAVITLSALGIQGILDYIKSKQPSP
jgi:hypothetical protein